MGKIEKTVVEVGDDSSDDCDDAGASYAGAEEETPASGNNNLGSVGGDAEGRRGGTGTGAVGVVGAQSASLQAELATEKANKRVRQQQETMMKSRFGRLLWTQN